MRPSLVISGLLTALLCSRAQTDDADAVIIEADLPEENKASPGNRLNTGNSALSGAVLGLGVGVIGSLLVGKLLEEKQCNPRGRRDTASSRFFGLGGKKCPDVHHGGYQQPNAPYQQPHAPYQQPHNPYPQPYNPHNQPSNVYHNPSNNYQQHQSSYNSYQQPSHGYQQPPNNYHASNSYQQPSNVYHHPNDGYQQPQDSYHRPSNVYQHEPTNSYHHPTNPYTTPYRPPHGRNSYTQSSSVNPTPNSFHGGLTLAGR